MTRSAAEIFQETIREELTHQRPKAVTRDQVKDATEEDPALQALKKYINQDWIYTNDTRNERMNENFILAR